VAVRVVMPQAGQDLETGTITAWLKSEGDTVARGEPIVSIETEKISVDVEAPAAGTLLRIVAPAGSEVPILSTIAIIGAPGEDISGLA
jgi:pyruvate/2-oxoglutarate dehydrogenase complex dihydrolipoamide acyltransferase (E2) component